MVAVKSAKLEKKTEAFIDELTAQGGPPLYTLTPEEARGVLESVQSGSVKKPSVKIEDRKIPVGSKAELAIRIIRPENVTHKLPITVYFHGGGWVMGSANTHDLLMRKLAIGSQSAIVYVHYSRSPEAKFPIALEECYAALKYIKEEGELFNLDTSRLAIAGDSVGGNISIAVTLLAKERKGPKIDCQVLFYPVTNSILNSSSYEEFSEGPWLTKKAMEWFWNAYEEDTNVRKKPLLSPLQASLDQLKGLPPALLITGENDVLRDEGEAYAHKLMQAGVEVMATRFLGTIHDFVMLNALAETPAVKGAVALASHYLHLALYKSSNLSNA